MRRIREETVSAVDRYSSTSCIPAAKASRLGASPDVIRERRAETAEGGKGGRVIGEEDGASSNDLEEGWSDDKIACCEGSRRDVSMFGSRLASCECRFVFRGSLDGGSACGIEGIEGCLRRALRACLSRWSL